MGTCSFRKLRKSGFRNEYYDFTLLNTQAKRACLAFTSLAGLTVKTNKMNVQLFVTQDNSRLKPWQLYAVSILSPPDLASASGLLHHCGQSACEFCKKKSATRTGCELLTATQGFLESLWHPASCEQVFRKKSVFRGSKSGHLRNDIYWYLF